MAFLYTLLVILFWSTTWLVIKLQMATGVSGEVSVAYRMAIASVILCAWCLARGQSLRYPKKDIFFMALQGVFNFGLNYIFAYIASTHINSGVHAVIFSAILPLNMLNGFLIFKIPIRLQTLWAMLFGIIGLCLVFRPELMRIEGTTSVWIGAFWAFTGALMASFGNMIAVRNQKAGIPIVHSNAIGTGFGAVFSCLVALMLGRSFVVHDVPLYVPCLLHLAILGTIGAFGSYFSLIKLVGAARAAYVNVMVPVAALLVSTLFEGYLWTIWAYVGLTLMVLGNIAMLYMRQKNMPPSSMSKVAFPRQD